jgi:hypothetical protein
VVEEVLLILSLLPAQYTGEFWPVPWKLASGVLGDPEEVWSCRCAVPAIVGRGARTVIKQRTRNSLIISISPLGIRS